MGRLCVQGTSDVRAMRLLPVPTFTRAIGSSVGGERLAASGDAKGASAAEDLCVGMHARRPPATTSLGGGVARVRQCLTTRDSCRTLPPRSRIPQHSHDKPAIRDENARRDACARARMKSLYRPPSGQDHNRSSAVNVRIFSGEERRKRVRTCMERRATTGACGSDRKEISRARPNPLTACHQPYNVCTAHRPFRPTRRGQALRPPLGLDHEFLSRRNACTPL